MAYTDIDKSDDYFNTVLYTGNGTSQSVTGVGFQPDWVWIKERQTVSSHFLYDVIRGTLIRLRTNDTGAEGSVSGSLTSFDSDGFSVGNYSNVNENTQPYASWNWKKSSLSGFDIVTYTGNGDTSATRTGIAHNLGVAPKMIIYKRLDSTSGWTISHKSLPNFTQAYLLLNSTNAFASSSPLTVQGSPSSVAFRPRWTDATNGNNINDANYVAYLFADVKGFSKFGSYTGNGSTDGTFVYTGFKPAWVLAKRTNDSSGWVLFDNKREPFNLADTSIRVDDSGAENQSNGALDFLSNGFKWRTTDTGVNGSGDSFIYMAFAENPLVTSTGIPTTAR